MSVALLFAAKGRIDTELLHQMIASSGGLEREDVNIHILCDNTTVLDRPAPHGVNVHHDSRPRSVFQLWGAGIRRASASHVAILDIHCPPSGRWIESVIAALNQGIDVGFGPVEPAYGAQDPRMVGYLTEYVQFHRPIAPGMLEVAGNNLFILRTLAVQAMTRPEDGFVKTASLAVLKPPDLLADAVVLHGKPFTLTGYCRRRFRHGRAFGARRSGWRLAALGMPALPLVRVWRVWQHARRVPICASAFGRFWAQILIAETAWSAGECLGYLAGRAQSEAELD